MKKLLSGLMIAAFVFSPVTFSFAADAQWNGTTNSLWATDTNWSAAHPGTGNTATFNNAGSGRRTIDLGGAASVKNIVLDPGNNSYTIGIWGVDTLTLNDLGSISMSATTTNVQWIDTDIVLGLDSASSSYTFTNSSNFNGLILEGNISGGAGGVAGVKTLTVNSGNNIGLWGVVSDGGATALALAKSGTSTLTLSGNNTYIGGTTLTAGTLRLNDSTAIGTGALTITGGSINNGAGSAITLTNNNVQNWNGDFTFVGSSALDLGTGAVAMDATRQVTVSASTLTVGGVIGDGGSGFGLTKDGAGTMVLSGTNTYRGATSINGGILQISTPGNLGDGSAMNTINFNGGTLRSTSNTYALGVNRDIALNGAGTIQTDAGTLTVDGDVTSGANTLTVTGSGNTTISGIVGIDGGNGGLTKTGAGTLTLSRANLYQGATTISAGTLAYGVDNTAGAVALNGGTLDLGTYTLTLSGSNAYSQAAGTILRCSITDSSNFGKIVATGADASVDSNATLNITVGDYIAAGTQFTVVDGKSTGTPGVPGTITSSSQRVTFSAVSSNGDLILTANRTGAYNTAAGDASGAAAGAALEAAGAAGATGDMLSVLNTLDSLSSGQLANALDTTAPDVSSGAADGGRALTSQGFTTVSNRLGGARNGGATGSGVSSGEMLNGVGVWMQGLGSHMKQDTRKGIEGYKANTFGTTIGADKVIDDHFRAGFAGGYGWARVKSKTPGSPSDDINSYQGTLYGSFDSLDLNKARQQGKKSYEAVRSQVENSWYVDGMFAFTQNNYDSRREIWLGTTKRVAKADHGAQQYSTNFETGYKFVFERTKKLEVTPFVTLGYNYLYMNKYKEDGANALNLTVNGEGFHQLEQGLGTKLAYPIVAKKAGTFIPSAKAAWLYDYIGDRFETTASFAGGGPSFNSQGAKPAQNGMLFGAELAFLNKGNMTMTGNWDIELKDQFMSNTYYGTVRYDF